MAHVNVHVRLVWENEKALRALRKVIEVLEDVGEDFAYRDDVQAGIKAGRYALRHIQLETTVCKPSS